MRGRAFVSRERHGGSGYLIFYSCNLRPLRRFSFNCLYIFCRGDTGFGLTIFYSEEIVIQRKRGYFCIYMYLFFFFLTAGVLNYNIGIFFFF